MPNGDAAAAAGLTVYSISDEAQDTYDAINVRGDELAAHITSGGHPFTRITGQALTAQIADGAVTTAKLATNAVQTVKVQDAAITADKLATNSVTTAKVAALAINGDKLATTLTKAGTWTIQGTPLTLQTPNTNHGIGISISGVEIESTAAVDITAPDIDIETVNGANGLNVATGTALLKSGSETTVQSAGAVTIDSGTAGITLQSDGAVDVNATGALALEGTTVTLDASGAATLNATGAVAIDGSSVTIGAAGSVLLNPTNYVSSDSIYSHTSSASANVYIDANGRLLRSTSSLRYKVDVRDAEPAPSILDVQPRTWADRNDPEGPRHFGVIAEELHDLGLGDLVVYDAEGRPDAVAYDRGWIPLVAVLREQRDQIADLTARVDALTKPAPRRTTKKGA